MVFSGHIIENFNSLLKNGFENFHIIETRFSLLRNGFKKIHIIEIGFNNKISIFHCYQRKVNGFDSFNIFEIF
jgi:hypothetical protein